MKSKLLAAFLLAFPATSTFANFNGSDDFNDNSKDTSKWGTDITANTAALTETNLHMHLTASGTDSDALRPWIANTGSYTSDWRMQLDVNVPTRALTSGQAYGFEFGVRNGGDSTDTFYVALELNNFGTQSRIFGTTFDVNGVAQPDVNTTTTSTSAALQIRYNAAATTLFADFDADGATNGYSFTNFDSRSVVPWGMNAGSVFNAVVGGFQQGNVIIVSGDNVFGDNFLAVPEPSSALLLAAGLMAFAGHRSSRTQNRRG